MLEHYASLITLCFRKQGPALLPPDSDKLCSLAGLVNSRAVSCTETSLFPLLLPLEIPNFLSRRSDHSTGASGSNLHSSLMVSSDRKPHCSS